MFSSGSARVNAPTPPATSLRVQSSVLGSAKPIGWGQNRLSGNLLWYGNFVAVPHTTQSGGSAGKGAVTGGGGGKGGSGSTTTYTYNTGVLLGLCEGPISAVLNAWNNKTIQSLASLNLTLLDGNYSQSPWAYLVSNSPGNARNYRGTAALGAGPMDLGQQQQLPNLSFEVQFAINSAISGLPDADPKDVLVDLLTNSYYGLGFPSARIGSLAVWSAYCRANGLVVSPVLTSAVAANSFIADLMKATNSEIVWASGKLTVVPYGDQSITANGSTYTAPSAPIYSIGETDLLPNSGGVSPEPVDIRRSSQAGAFNMVKFAFMDRNNAYNPDVVMAQDEASVLEYGPRPTDVNMSSMYCDRAAAQMAAQLFLGRQSVRNLPTITLGPEFILLDPMDIISFTDTILGASSQWVRIRQIQENADDSLTLTLEEYAAGSAAAPIYGSQANSGYTPNYNVAPGAANTPAIFDVPVSLADTVGLETWLATSGGANWGGCEVHISTDGTTYAFAGTINGPSRMGVLSANMASGSDPETVNTLAVDLTTSRASLAGGTLNDADRANTLCFVDGEYMSYQQATLTSAYHYDLGKHGGTAGYLRRGLYGSAITSHLSGSLFVRLDDSVFVRPYTKADVGQTIYVKLVSFNIWQGALEDISTVSVYTHVIGGPPTVYAPSGLTVTAGIKSIQLTWTNPPDIGVEAVEIWRSASSSFGSASHIGDASPFASTYTDLTTGSATAYWYWIRIRDIAGHFSAYSPSSGGAGATVTTAQANTADLAPNSATPSKINIGASDNLLLDSSLIDVTYWSPVSTSLSISGPYGGLWNNANVMFTGAIPGGGAVSVQSPFIKCQPGDSFYASEFIGEGSGSATHMYLRIYAYDGAQNYMSFTDLQIILSATGGPHFLSGYYTAPAGANFIIWAALWVSIAGGNQGTMSAPVLRRMTDSNLLLGNNVNTFHMVSGSITGSTIGTGSGTPIGLSSWTTCASITMSISSAASNVLLQFADYWTWSGSGPRGFYRILRDGSTVVATIGLGGGSCPDYLIAAGGALDSGLSGSHTWTLQAEYVAGNQPTSQQAIIIGTELKK